MSPDGSGRLYVPGLTQVSVHSPEDIHRVRDTPPSCTGGMLAQMSRDRRTCPQVFELGHMNRATACTNLNEHSSRSHALLIVSVCGYNRVTGSRTQGTHTHTHT